MLGVPIADSLAVTILFLGICRQVSKKNEGLIYEAIVQQNKASQDDQNDFVPYNSLLMGSDRYRSRQKAHGTNEHDIKYMETCVQTAHRQ